MRRILFITAVKHPLFDRLTETLARRGMSLGRVVLSPTIGRNGILRAIHAIGRAMKVLLIDGRGFSDVSLHFVGFDTLSLSLVAAIMRKRIHLHFWGSDIGKFNLLPKFVQRRVLMSAYTITFATEAARDLLCSYDQSLKEKTFIVPFGLDLLPFLDQIKHEGNDAESTRETVIVCGTNSSRNQQILEMIPYLEAFAGHRKDTLRFVFPLNYGDENYRTEVKERLSASALRYEIVETFMVGTELANFRASTTVLIQIQKHDALSAAMLESLYAGSRVITGSWLPYDVLRSQGVDWIEIDGLSELPVALERALDFNLNFVKNHNLVGTLFDWNSVSPVWVNALTRV